MTEAEWLVCGDPGEMLERVPLWAASDRKCRLLGCAFLRCSNPLPNSPCWASVELAERWADGAATEEEVRAFQNADPTANWATLIQPAQDLLHLCANAVGEAWRLIPGLLREFFGNPFRPVRLAPVCRTPAILSLAQAAYEERILPAGYLDPQRLSVLADALEEAGCTDQAILDHLRGLGPHTRGCWPVDLLLARE